MVPFTYVGHIEGFTLQRYPKFNIMIDDIVIHGGLLLLKTWTAFVFKANSFMSVYYSVAYVPTSCQSTCNKLILVLPRPLIVHFLFKTITWRCCDSCLILNIVNDIENGGKYCDIWYISYRLKPRGISIKLKLIHTQLQTPLSAFKDFTDQHPRHLRVKWNNLTTNFTISHHL